MNQTPNITKDFDLEDISFLHVKTLAGNIELVGFEENCFKVEVFFSTRGIGSFFFERENLSFVDAERFVLNFKKENKTLEIFAKPNYWNPYNWLNFLQVSFRIYVPESISTHLTTWGGNIALRNTSGSHEFMTWGGNILIEKAKGNLKGNTMGGKVEVIGSDATIQTKTWGGKIFLSENQGEIVARTYGGNISILNQKGRVSATTSGGNIKCNGLVGELKCSTSGGKIKLYDINGSVGASTLGGNIEAEVKSIKEYLWLDSSGGNINAVLPLNQGLNLDIYGYRIYTPPMTNFEGYKTQSEINGKLNGGGASVKINVKGNVNIVSSIEKSTPKTVFQEVQNTFSVSKKTDSKKENLSTYNLNSFLIGLFFCSILCYGLSSITYFTLEIFNPLDKLSAIYKGVFFSNIANGIAAFLGVNFFVRFFELRLNQTWLKHIILLATTYGFVSIFQAFVGILYWRTLSDEVLSERTNNTDFILYSIVPLVVSWAYYFYWQRTRQITRKISEQEYQLLNLEKLKTKSDLSALQARINPHFLYNSLNSIASLVHTDPDKAEEMTILLSKLFRYTTDRNNEDFNSIRDELEIVKAYLSVEQVRFGDRLKFSTDLEKGLEDYQIPRLLLQPIVENAIKHGISKSSGEEKIEIKIFRKNEIVILSVHDSGQLFPTEMTSGYGLRSIKEKLKLIYSEKASLEIQNHEKYKAVVIQLSAVS